jgi:hypothetical protein
MREAHRSREGCDTEKNVPLRSRLRNHPAAAPATTQLSAHFLDTLRHVAREYPMPTVSALA